ncbi:MAG: sterol desaturase family protein [Ginsengibacter sp.]
MMHIDPILVYATPALLLLIGVENALIGREHVHGGREMFSSLGLVLGRMPLAAVTNGIAVLLYTFIYQYRLFTLPGIYWWSWMICFFADDFSYYWFHRLSHQIRFLWASHSVHHSSKQFTFTSGMRVPWTSDITGNFLFWAWMPLIGIAPYMIVVMKTVGVLYQFWLHTEKIKNLPKWLEAVFNTPAHHRIHHSSNVEYLDKNHAGTLILWDRLFGTYQGEISAPKYGLTEDVKSFNPFVIAFQEWKKLLKDIKTSKSMRDRFQYLFKAPGWSPDGASKTAKQLQSQIKQVKTAIGLTPLSTYSINDYHE